MPLLPGVDAPFLDNRQAWVRVPARVAIALAAGGAALLLTAALEPLVVRAPFFPAFLAIALVSWLSGFRYAVLTAVAFATEYVYFFLEPRSDWAISDQREVMGIAAYLVAGVLVAAMGGSLRRAYARLREQHHQLQALHEQREDVLRIVTHDLRSPLSVISGQAALITREAPDTDLSRRLAMIERNAAQAATILRDLVDTVRLEAGHVKLECKPTGLRALVAGMRSRLGHDADRVVLAIPEELPMVEVDPSHFERVLENLVTNALKYSPAHTPVVIAAVEQGGYVALTVADKGPGISAEDLPHIFDKYYRVGPAQEKAGLGLGLYIVRLLVEAHGGRISVDSALDKGTTFSVVMPLAEPAVPAEHPGTALSSS
ncbi:MAG TPA: ATP-binding protein [Anaeromyxobacteraceae bacterium]|nr:ATP-binding protein [Anaeromyxobacteraceae bacterium]